VRTLPLLHRGKVRDIYAVDDDYLLIVTTDRLSAFDVILPDPIPGKGQVLQQISDFWFGRTAHIVANHVSARPLASRAARRRPVTFPQPASWSRVVGRATSLASRS